MFSRKYLRKMQSQRNQKALRKGRFKKTPSNFFIRKIRAKQIANRILNRGD